MVRWLVEAELGLAVAEVADGSREVSGVLAVVRVLGWKKLALDRNSELQLCSLILYGLW